MIITSTIPSFLGRQEGQEINRADGTFRVVKVIDRRPHPAGIRMGSSAADVVTCEVERVTAV